MNLKPVICLGCAFWDTIFKVDRIPGRGTKILPEKAVQSASGMATAAAVTVARLGAPVELWARVGDDMTGESFLRDLETEGVGTGSVRRIQGARTAFSTILVDADGERLVVPYTDPSLDDDPRWLPLDKVEGAGAVLVDMRWRKGAIAVLAEARRHGVPSVIDADIAPPDTLRELTALGDHVLFSEPALMSLVPTAFPEDALLQIAQSLPAEILGVTLGERGALIRRRTDAAGEVHRFPAMPVRAVDTLNAGDIWHGTYVFGLVAGWDLPTSVHAANIAAAMKCEHFGGRAGAPHLPDLQDRVARHDTARVGSHEPVGPRR